MRTGTQHETWSNFKINDIIEVNDEHRWYEAKVIGVNDNYIKINYIDGAQNMMKKSI